MQIKFRAGYLVITRRDKRVTQYKLPKRIHFFYGVAAITMIFFAANPVVTSLVGQAATELDPGKLSQAAQVAIDQFKADALNVVFVSRPPRHSELPTYHLQIPDNTLQQMQCSLVVGDPALNHEPGGIKPYFKAVLSTGGTPTPVKICLRGTMHWHHRTAKPSFRIKLKKDDVSSGDRYIELTTPEDSLVLNNWLPMQLAADLDLMTDASRHVRLFINKKYFGVYVRSTRPGEPFALANQRMPGTFFKAEFGERMWESAGAWKKFGQQDPQDVAVFQRWLDTLAGPVTAANIELFSTIFDTEKFARWAALMTVVGSIHTDDQHNHSYFFCSNQGKLEPLPWDCNGYGLHTQPDSPVDVQVQPVLRFLSSDPRWVHRRNQWIHRLITESASTTRIGRTVDQCLAAMRDDLMADRNLGDLKKYSGTGWNWMPASVADTDAMRKKLIRWIDGRNRYLARYLDHARFSIETDSAKVSLINVFGTVAVDVINNDTGESTTLYPGLTQKRWVHTSAQQQAEIQFLYLRPATQTYRLEASPEQLSFRNAITGESISPNELSNDHLSALPESRTIRPDQFKPAAKTNVVLGPGRVDVERDIIVGGEQELTVLPGTTLVLSPGVGIYSRGKTRFSGTASQPIHVRGSHKQPWAAIGISGTRTKNSIFEYVDVAGGSIGKLDELRFKGMVNVYDCPRITLRNCRFGANQIGDDAVNLAESGVYVDRCHWFNARADALDLDMCHGTVKNCRWTNSGNDGLDLMHCDLKISDCRIVGSGDKGISVGENSRLTAHSVSIADCTVGSEIKDDSVAKFVECEFSNCHIAVHSYQKKWFYPAGGRTALVDCKISGSHERDVDMQAKSAAVLIRTSISQLATSPKHIQVLDSLPEAWETMLQPKRYLSQKEGR